MFCILSASLFVCFVASWLSLCVCLLAYLLSWFSGLVGKAAEKGIICRYKVLITVVTDSMVSEYLNNSVVNLENLLYTLYIHMQVFDVLFLIHSYSILYCVSYSFCLNFHWNILKIMQQKIRMQE